jgi:hypothetical protein
MIFCSIFDMSHQMNERKSDIYWTWIGNELQFV